MTRQRQSEWNSLWDESLNGSQKDSCLAGEVRFVPTTAGYMGGGGLEALSNSGGGGGVLVLVLLLLMLLW